MRVRALSGTTASGAGVLAATILAAGQAAPLVPLEKWKLPASTSSRGATARQFGRPADEQPLKDRSLLISGDTPGRIYRVAYGK